jgi:hypothetical protein
MIIIYFQNSQLIIFNLIKDDENKYINYYKRLINNYF